MFRSAPIEERTGCWRRIARVESQRLIPPWGPNLTQRKRTPPLSKGKIIANKERHKRGVKKNQKKTEIQDIQRFWFFEQKKQQMIWEGVTSPLSDRFLVCIMPALSIYTLPHLSYRPFGLKNERAVKLRFEPFL